MKQFACHWVRAVVVLSSALLVAVSALAMDVKPDPLCGPNCLLTVCRQMKIDASLDELSVLCGYKANEGASLSGLYRAVKAKGLQAVGVKIGLSELSGLDVVAIAHLWGNHFVVVERGDTDAVKVTDPPREPRLIPLRDFAESYSGFALLVAKDDSHFPPDKADGPDLRFDSYYYDAGFLSPGERVLHTFDFRNVGNKEVVMSEVRTSCTCASATASSPIVPPEGKGQITVSFDTTGLLGSQRQTVYVHSNDPITPIAQLTVEALLKPNLLVMSSRSLDFGTVKKGVPTVREFYVRDPGDGSLQVTKCTSDSPFISVASAPYADHGHSGYRIAATLSSQAPVGELEANVMLSTNLPDEPLAKVRIAATVRGDIEVLPDVFFLGLVKRGKAVEKTVRLSTRGTKALQIKKASSPFEYVLVTTRPDVDGKSYAVTAKVNDRAPIGSIQGDVIVFTNDPDQPEIRIPLFAFVTEE